MLRLSSFYDGYYYGDNESVTVTVLCSEDEKAYDHYMSPHAMTWTEAEEWCSEYYDAHLVSIHNDDEREWAANVCSVDDCWIGGYRINDESDSVEIGNFSWSDGTPFDYTAWADGEPVAGVEQTYDGVSQNANASWNVVDSDTQIHALCGDSGTF